MSHENTLKMLLEADYVTYLKRVKANSLYLSIPKTTSNRHMVITYGIKTGESGYKYVERGSVAIQKNTMHLVPHYAVRPLITADIHRICKIIEYNPELLLFYNEKDIVVGQGELGLISSNLINQPKGKDARDKELELLALFSKMKEVGELGQLADYAMEKGILEGYQQIVEIYR